MEILPYPIPPTDAEIRLEEQQVRCLLFAGPRLVVLSLMLFAVAVAVALSYNFNVMQWLE
jgi:hypothetical protein